jgi:signal transduction histidine kinase
MPGAAAGDRSARQVRRLAGGWLSPDRMQTWVAVSLIPIAASSILLSLTSDHLEYPRATAAYKTYVAVAPILVGLLWWRRRPASRFGSLLVVLGYASWLLAWRASDQSLGYTVGALGDAPTTVMSLYLCLAFPTGRLRSVVERLLIAALALVVSAFYASQLLFAPVLSGSEPFSACVSDCPGNPFQIGSQPGLLDALAEAVTYTGLAVVVGVAAVWIRRLRTATRPQRRALVPVACSSLLLVPALFAYYFALLVLDVGGSTADVLGWFLVAAFVVFPLGFAVALLQADLFAGRALHRLLREVAARPTLERWRDAVADAVDDPSLRLAFRDPISGRFREADGSELVRPPDGSDVLWVPVTNGEGEVAAMVVDEALTQDPELLDAATAATLLAVEAGALEGELRASRRRLLEVGDAERRRIGRDLHDSAQQRLVALRVHLSLAGERLERPEERTLVEELGRELDAALEELRTVAQGIFPAVLAQYGVAAALRSVSRDAAIPVSIDGAEFRRHPEAIELAVYFSCLEALQNAAKHAGPRARATVRLADDEHAVRFSVEDDGVGFEPAAVERGSGLANLGDRMAAVGGTLRIESRPGRGTRVAGHIPL